MRRGWAGRWWPQRRSEDRAEGWVCLWEGAARYPALTPAPPLQRDGAVPPRVRPGLRERLMRGARPLPLPLRLCRPQLLHGVSLQPPQRVRRCGGPRPLPALPQSHQGVRPGPQTLAPGLCAFSLHSGILSLLPSPSELGTGRRGPSPIPRKYERTPGTPSGSVPQRGRPG